MTNKINLTLQETGVDVYHPLSFLSLNLYFILACSNFQFTDILDLFRGFCGLMADNDKIRAGHIKISMMLFMNSPISFFTTVQWNMLQS